MSNKTGEKTHPSVLFVCTGNICRSPMAEALFRGMLNERAPDGQSWRVESAGTWADEGIPASRYAVQVMAERGINISAHTARTIQRDSLETFDLILTMEPEHKEVLKTKFPDLEQRIFLLTEMIGSNDPIADPYGGSLEEYRETARIIDQVLAGGMQRILALVKIIRS